MKINETGRRFRSGQPRASVYIGRITDPLLPDSAATSRKSSTTSEYQGIHRQGISLDYLSEGCYFDHLKSVNNVDNRRSFLFAMKNQETE